MVRGRPGQSCATACPASSGAWAASLRETNSVKIRTRLVLRVSPSVSSQTDPWVCRTVPGTLASAGSASPMKQGSVVIPSPCLAAAICASLSRSARHWPGARIRGGAPGRSGFDGFDNGIGAGHGGERRQRGERGLDLLQTGNGEDEFGARFLSPRPSGRGRQARDQQDRVARLQPLDGGLAGRGGDRRSGDEAGIGVELAGDRQAARFSFDRGADLMGDGDGTRAGQRRGADDDAADLLLDGKLGGRTRRRRR